MKVILQIKNMIIHQTIGVSTKPEGVQRINAKKTKAAARMISDTRRT